MITNERYLQLALECDGDPDQWAITEDDLLALCARVATEARAEQIRIDAGICDALYNKRDGRNLTDQEQGVLNGLAQAEDSILAQLPENERAGGEG
jgi:hypothetical protein